MVTENQDSALADLTEQQFQHQLDTKSASDWLAIRELQRSGDISFRNWQDARIRNNCEAISSGALPEMSTDEMKINSPEHHYHYPQQTQPASKLGPLAKAAIGLAATTILGGSGVGAAYFIGEALKSRPVLQGIDTDTTIIQRFVDQKADWIQQND